MLRIVRTSAVRVAGIGLLLIASSALVRAHDVPDEIVIQSFLKPAGTQLQVLLRVPLLAVAASTLPKDGTGYLAMPYLAPALREAANQIASGIVFLEDDERLSEFAVVNGLISLPSDKSFDSYDRAAAHVHGPPLPETTQLYYNQGYLDLELTYPIRSEHAEFAIQTLIGQGLAHRTVTLVTFLRPDGRSRFFRLVDQTAVIQLDPRRLQVARVFLADGFFRFVDGLEALLFVGLLVLPYRRVRDLLWPVASFALAHTLALMLASSGFMPIGSWFPALIGALAALSIVYVAAEDALGINLRRRWAVAFACGGIYGFAFAFAFHDLLQYAGGHPVAALLSFNTGIEIGQLLILSIVFPTFGLLLGQLTSERPVIILISALAGHTAWHWMTDRFASLQLVDWPAFDLAFAAAAVRWILMLTVLGGGIWVLTGLLRTKAGARERKSEGA